MHFLLLFLMLILTDVVFLIANREVVACIGWQCNFTYQLSLIENLL